MQNQQSVRQSQFLNRSELARLCDVEPNAFRHVVDGGAIPQPTHKYGQSKRLYYTVSEARIIKATIDRFRAETGA